MGNDLGVASALGKGSTFAENAKIDWIRTKAPFAYPVFFGWRTKNLGRKEPSMLVIRCDFHPSWQHVCWVDTITGETEEKKLVHGSGEAKRFYRQLSGRR